MNSTGLPLRRSSMTAIRNASMSAAVHAIGSAAARLGMVRRKSVTVLADVVVPDTTVHDVEVDSVGLVIGGDREALAVT